MKIYTAASLYRTSLCRYVAWFGFSSAFTTNVKVTKKMVFSNIVREDAEKKEWGGGEGVRLQYPLFFGNDNYNINERKKKLLTLLSDV